MSLASPEIIEAYRDGDLYLLIILLTTPNQHGNKTGTRKARSAKRG
jgi:hypothetical protein